MNEKLKVGDAVYLRHDPNIHYTYVSKCDETYGNFVFNLADKSTQYVRFPFEIVVKVEEV